MNYGRTANMSETLVWPRMRTWSLKGTHSWWYSKRCFFNKILHVCRFHQRKLLTHESVNDNIIVSDEYEKSMKIQNTVSKKCIVDKHYLNGCHDIMDYRYYIDRYSCILGNSCMASHSCCIPFLRKLIQQKIARLSPTYNGLSLGHALKRHLSEVHIKLGIAPLNFTK